MPNLGYLNTNVIKNTVESLFSAVLNLALAVLYLPPVVKVWLKLISASLFLAPVWLRPYICQGFFFLSRLFSGCVYTYTDSKVSGYPGRRYQGKCEAFTRIQISGAVVRHACAMGYQHDLRPRPSFEGQSCLAARYLSGFSVIHES